ncbi:malonyl-ACP O-methyltransferase BioC [Thioalkalivibrio paradoxus]|uniref:Malonyl-[acyl-carrier protein] O-methyltransferase n=1 Tax=Thioalkalivibrio paradoxus ARh 1 TaxID=713585 RepID=W0DM22_9GAMM|nr:malonyl-ACP O-methyltransferase BioC [Thioalkalivibrio paradoxus]AHE99634.1 malonyl-CoA O-methyltransferase [Thioalkalivibrio paradoxus ARh 1]
MKDGFEIDKALVRAAFDRAAHDYERHARLQQEVQQRLLERLDWIRIEPARVIDLGCGPGGALKALAQRYRKARVAGLDFAQGMALRARAQGRWFRRPWAICADMERLPLADASFDLAISAAALQWVTDLDRVFAEVRRVVAPGGLWLFATFGPDTLRELREAFARVDAGSAVHVNAFIDMHDIGDALVRAGFADPVMDQERLTVTYPDLPALLRDLRGVGVRNALSGRHRGLLGPRRLRAVADAYLSQYGEQGRLPASWEVVYGHAWVPAAPPPSRFPGRFIPVRPG